MIKRITNEEYLERVDGMQTGEREEYLKRVGEWLNNQARLVAPKKNEDSAQFMNVAQCSATWNDTECKAWEDGVVLLTALQGTEETWLPDMLYAKSAKRAIRRLIDSLKSVVAVTAEKPVIGIPPRMEGTKKGSGGTETIQVLPSGNAPVPQRPKHIDQYIHLLPKKTQEKAALIRGFLREEDVARENARILMDANGQADKIAQWAKTATALDDKIRAIYKEIDDEWAKLVNSGKVLVDMFGNAYIPEAANQQAAEEPEQEPAATPAAEPAAQEPVSEPADKETAEVPAGQQEKPADGLKATDIKRDERSQEDIRKAASLRKWLIDSRNAKTPDHKEKWLAKYSEMIALGGEQSVTQKVLDAAKQYGYELPKQN